jgi:diguanylate cyclase (GGDEF)-like protein
VTTTGELARLRSELEQLRVELEAERHAARHDPLTGVLNRRGGTEAIARLRPTFAVALIDLDHFRRFNRLEGRHATGDRVLRGLTRLLVGGVRREDLVIRWGGEEFLVVLAHTDAEGAGRLLERFLDQVRDELRVVDTTVTFSAGVAEVTPGGDFADALATADRSLAAAKAEGRARVVVSSA